MTDSPRKSSLLVWAGLLLVIATVLVIALQLKLRGTFNKPLPIYGEVGNFILTNQLGGRFSLADLQGRVWLADIIFTTCPGPCLNMSRQMQQISQALPPDSAARLISLTTYPEYDTPQVLSAYAHQLGADTNRWSFLTGPKSEIAKLAIDSLKLTAIEKKPEERESADDLFIHSTIFVLVDKRAQLRGVFETTGEDIDWRKIKADILSAMHQLEREP